MSVIYRPGMRLADLPIPEDAEVTARWPSQMVEMADYIGAYATLRIIEAHGGQQVYISSDPDRSPFRDVLGPRLAKKMAEIYGGTQTDLPVGRHALTEARRAPVLASVRNGDMTTREAAKILGTSRIYLSQIVNSTPEAADAAPLRRTGIRDPRQIELFGPSD